VCPAEKKSNTKGKELVETQQPKTLTGEERRGVAFSFKNN